MKRKFAILIVGGGITGLTLAALLARGPARERLDVSVADAGARPRFDPDGDVALRVSAISTGSSRLYASLGVWAQVLAVRACPYTAMRVWDARSHVDGAATLRFDADEFTVPELGSIVENALLRDVLLRQLESTGVDVAFETPIRSLRAAGERFEIEFPDAVIAHPELVVGSDGASSFVRRQARIGSYVRRYDQSAFVTHVRPERDHRHTAWQRFLPEGPLALLPLADGRVSVVWSTAPAQADEAMRASDGELSERLSGASDCVLGSLQVAGPRGRFPLRAQHAARYVGPGLALIGDAAHSIHPLAGQGANLGVADAAVLARVIAEAVARGEYPGDLPALRRYERARRGANATMLNFVDGLNRLFGASSTGLVALRRAGMTLFNHSGPIRRRAVETALGIGDHDT